MNTRIGPLDNQHAQPAGGNTSSAAVPDFTQLLPSTFPALSLSRPQRNRRERQGIRFNVNPYEAGYFCCYVKSNTTPGFYLDFRCEQGYTGRVTATITVNDINIIGKAVSECFSFRCR